MRGLQRPGIPNGAWRPLVTESALTAPTNASSPQPVDLAIIGAGPAGLGAAWRTAAAGHEVVVLDGATRIGGLAASFVVGGVTVDHGSHRLHPATPPPVLSALRDLLGTELQSRRRRGRIRLFDRWLDFPLRPAQLVRALPLGFTARAGISAAAAMIRPARDATFADHVTSGLGRVMGQEFYFPYARKIWGLDPDRIAGEQARRRIAAASPARLLARATAPADSSTRQFFYPAGGFGRICESLAAAATAAAADLRLGNAVTELTREPDGTWRVVTAAGSVRARRVWSTVPVTVLARLVGLRAPELAYRAMVLVYLVVRGGRYSPYDAHYLPSPGTPVTRISEPANYRDSPSDPPDRTVLCAEIPCDLGDTTWSASDDQLCGIVVSALLWSALPPPDVAEVHVRRVPHAYPVYEVGYEGGLDPLLTAVDSMPGLLTFGRQGLFAHDNTHHALAMAWAAADCLAADGSFDQVGWRHARERFTEHVVQD